MHGCLIRAASESELQVLEVFMDSRLIVIEILIVVIIALDHFAPALKSVRLCNQNIVQAFPRNVVSQEDSRHADALQFLHPSDT